MPTIPTNFFSQARTYYRLTKPGIIYGNALMFAAGFFLGSWDGVNWPLFFEALLGLSFVMASACVFNNYADRELDKKMERTKSRSLVTGAISPNAAYIYGLVLALIGFGALYFFSSYLSFLIALIGFATYVFLYTPLKPKTSFALYIGAVAGATPPVVGYTAITGNFDWWALLLFVAMFLWQLPHFVAIATYRYEEYTAAGVPLTVKRQPTEEEKKKAKKIFALSLVILLAACLGIALWRLLFSVLL